MLSSDWIKQEKERLFKTTESFLITKPYEEAYKKLYGYFEEYMSYSSKYLPKEIFADFVDADTVTFVIKSIIRDQGIAGIRDYIRGADLTKDIFELRYDDSLKNVGKKSLIKLKRDILLGMKNWLNR